MRDSGYAGLVVGLETFWARALRSYDKGFSTPADCGAAVAKFPEYGIFVEAGIVFGFDGDTPKVLDDTLAVLDDIGVDAIQPSVPTPQPGTPLSTQMRDRIVDTNREHYDFKHAVFQPADMTREELEEGTWWVVSQFYSPRRIALPRWYTMAPVSRSSRAAPAVSCLDTPRRVASWA